ncbi:MAG: hypothetical protein RL272_1266 [Candidatus Parcubacteria bacterium]|jgi:hypothetical protein
MPTEHIAAAMARDPHLDDRRRSLFELAATHACKESNVSDRNSSSEGDRVTYECARGEIRIVVDMFRADKGRVTETLDLRLYEYGMLVFHVSGRRLSTDRAYDRVSAKVAVYIESYWEAILRYIV